MTAPSGPTKNFRRRQAGLLTHRTMGRMRAPERPMMDDHIAGAVLEVSIGAETEIVVLHLGRGIDPTPLVSAERPLLLVAGNDVLTKLGTDRLQPETCVPHHRKVAQDRMPPL